MSENGYETGRLNLPFVGISTFAKKPYVADWDAIDADVAVLGAPFDFGTQWRPGARFGPRAVREASTLFSFGHAGAYDHEDDATYLGGDVRIVDIGDADIIHTKTTESHAAAAQNIRAWQSEIDHGGLDAVVINTSGCGTTVKDYGHMFRDSDLAEEAAQISKLTMDVSELLMQLDMPDLEQKNIKVAYHAACSLQHGQQIKTFPKTLLQKAGFTVLEPADPHLCCGSAGTYNLMQPEISSQLKTRKVANLEALQPDIIAAGNIGCMMQIGSGTAVPVVHSVELLDWATGGPQPAALRAGYASHGDGIPRLR